MKESVNNPYTWKEVRIKIIVGSKSSKFKFLRNWLLLRLNKNKSDKQKSLRLAGKITYPKLSRKRANREEKTDYSSK